MIDYAILYRNIKGLVKRQGITLREFESIIQTSPGYISRCAHSTHKSKRMSIDTVIKIAKYFNVSIEDLISKELVEHSYHIKVHVISRDDGKCTVETEHGRLLEVYENDLEELFER